MKVREGGVARLVGQHAVDVGGLEPGIEDGVAHRPGAERARGLAGAARVGGLAHPDDGVLVSEVFGRRDVGVGWQWHGARSSGRFVNCDGDEVGLLGPLADEGAWPSRISCAGYIAAGAPLRNQADYAERQHPSEPCRNGVRRVEGQAQPDGRPARESQPERSRRNGRYRQHEPHMPRAVTAASRRHAHRHENDPREGLHQKSGSRCRRCFAGNCDRHGRDATD